MSVRYQGGYLRCVKCKSGSWCWEFLWRDSGPTGKQKRRTMKVGSLEEYSTQEPAFVALSCRRTHVLAATK
jgi:hypothetical protein